MVTDHDAFWAAPQGAARFKHRVIRNQLGAFTGKTGKTAQGQRVVFLDGYAGPGAYDVGDPGSPEIAVEVAESLKDFRNLEGVFIELRAKYARALRKRLDERGYSHWTVRKGSCEEQLPAVLQLVGEAPLLVFLDPYGLSIPFDALMRDILGRPGGQGWSRTRKTEVILNFSASALRRLGGFLDKDYDRDALRRYSLFELVDEEEAAQDEERKIAVRKAKQAAALKALDDFLGGDWWRDLKRTGGPDWPSKVRTRWLEEVRARAGNSWMAYDVPVSDTHDGPPAYHLVLLTQSNEGIWVFNEGVSLAYERLYKETWKPPPSGSLFGDDQLSEPLSLAPALIDALAENIRALVGTGRRVEVLHSLQELYGPALGKARSTHLVRAIKVVHAEGLLAGPAPKSKDLKGYTIVPVRSAGISS